ncbi:MAG: DNA-protecting protein DprA [Ruminococcaceae bacterium]|nr:DNA-protecting protein DprA [Oscillospiraceae bacterium]
MSLDAEEMVFCLLISRLQRIPGVDHRSLRRRLLEQGRSLDVAALLSPRLPLCPSGLPDRSELLAKAEKAVLAGIGACCLCDERYPYRLRQADSCPLVLYYRGREPSSIWNQAFAVTVIGTRSPTQYGRLVTRRIVADLAREGTLIISGLARGIDALAHEAALCHGAPTLAVLAQGVDQVYPPENRLLLERIAREGLLLSEHPPGTKPLRHYFPARNRILSGLADVVAVMEAARKSGTLITAGFAADQGREVLAVPGSILHDRSEGCHQLLRDGAGLLETADDLLQLRPSSVLVEQMGGPIRAKRPCSGFSDESDNIGCQPSAEDRALLQQLAACALTLEELGEVLSWPVRRTAVWVSEMETQGFICRERGRYFLTERGVFCI